ncbi:hypothetical protein ACHAW5_006553 [Stephanodiscus triporus]|uniref:Uncharacterized protein n=1 Tax=Stephanodiscus triporus TaxID=2934178 RepID=A0ABD3MKN2_9STRA
MMTTKASVPPLLAGTTAIFSLMFGTASADCLVEGDMMFYEGQSMGHLGVECLNSTSYNATDTVCGPDGEMIESPAVYTCPTSDPEFDPDGLYAAPFCVQCSPPGPGSALCLSSPDLPSNCVGVDNDEDFLPQATRALNATSAHAPTVSPALNTPSLPGGGTTTTLSPNNFGTYIDDILCTWQEWFDGFAEEPEQACVQFNDGYHTVPYSCDGDYEIVCCTVSDLVSTILDPFGTCTRIGDAESSPSLQEGTPAASPGSSPDKIRCTSQEWFDEFVEEPGQVCVNFDDGDHTVPYSCDGENEIVCCTVSDLVNFILDPFGTCTRIGDAESSPSLQEGTPAASPGSSSSSQEGTPAASSGSSSSLQEGTPAASPVQTSPSSPQATGSSGGDAGSSPSLQEGTPATSPGSSPSSQEGTPAASPAPTSPSSPQATVSSAPKDKLVVALASTTGILATLLYIS